MTSQQPTDVKGIASDKEPAAEGIARPAPKLQEGDLGRVRDRPEPAAKALNLSLF
jgi:hypothetical protein